MGLTQEKAEELGVEKISDLEGKSQDLTLYGSPECRQRNDCLLGLQQVYGLEFKQFKPVDIALRHEVLTKGQADVSIVFTTDPQIEREGFVLLEDDKGMFPPYNSTLVVRDETVEEAGPDLPKVVDLVNEGLTAEVMQELNARVDLDKKTPEEVAGEYLQETGRASRRDPPAPLRSKARCSSSTSGGCRSRRSGCAARRRSRWRMRSARSRCGAPRRSGLPPHTGWRWRRTATPRTSCWRPAGRPP